jgi:hypothetical protein
VTASGKADLLHWCLRRGAHPQADAALRRALRHDKKVLYQRFWWQLLGGAIAIPPHSPGH